MNNNCFLFQYQLPQTAALTLISLPLFKKPPQYLELAFGGAPN